MSGLVYPAFLCFLEGSVFFTTNARSAFDANHHLDEDHPGCGHRWSVEVVTRQRYDITKQRLTVSKDLQAALEALLEPLYNRSLNEMVTGVTPSPEGLCTWISEQLALFFPEITEVTVTASYGPSVTMHRELRRPGGPM